MRIKDGKGKKIELIFLITATTLTVFLLVYLIWLVRHLVDKADIVFSVDTKDPATVPAFNFKKYDEIFKTPSSSVVDTQKATSSASPPAKQ